MRFKRARYWMGGLGGLSVLAAVGGWVLSRYYPLEIAEWKTGRELRSAGALIHSSSFQGRIVRAWVRDHCDSRDPGCRCLILVHGLGDRATTWKRVLKADASTWQLPIRLIAVDLPGSGGSERPARDEGYSLRQLAAAAAELVQSISSCGDYWVVGNSMGGGVAVWMALGPLKVRRLILLSPGGLDGPPHVDPENLQEGIAHVPAHELLRNPTVESLKEFQRRTYFKPRPLPDHVWEAAVQRAKKSSSSDILRAQTPKDFPGSRLQEILAPVVLIWGLSDHVTPVEGGRELVKRFRTGVLREVPECGHLPQKECPEAIFSAVNDLLRVGG